MFIYPGTKKFYPICLISSTMMRIRLYPFAMQKFEMPVGIPTMFEGDITKVDPNAYGFFRCEVTSPEFLEHPILQRRIRTSSGMRTIAGLGS